MKALLAAAGLLLFTACAGPTLLVPGENLREQDAPPPKIEILIIAADDFAPIAGAEMVLGSLTLSTGADGRAGGEWPGPGTASLTAPGFKSVNVQLDELPGGPIEVNMVPLLLLGTVVASDGTTLADAIVTMGAVQSVTDEGGRFVVPRAVPDKLTVVRPAWMDVELDWDGVATNIEIVLEPRTVRGLRVSGPAAGDPGHWRALLDLAAGSAINALVVDLKDESGTVYYSSQVTEARSSGAVQVFYDIEDVVSALDRRDLYSIGRIAVFQDSFFAAARPDAAATDVTTGQPWRNPAGEAWLDPTDRASWEYSLALAVEACEAGFQEIQFDFVRFPSEGRLRDIRYDGGDLDQEGRLAAITGYLGQARDRLHPMGCALGVDMISIVLSARNDQGVGLRPEELSNVVDVLNPTVYPALYGTGWLGFEDPNQFPSEVVSNALDSGLDRIEGTAIMRPWLQTFSYGPTEVSIEINEAEERGLGWMLWSAGSRFSASLLPDAPDEG